MIRALIILLCLGNAPLCIFANELPPGVLSARFLPGWTDENGGRVTALELRLEPGWKTYWRSPGGSGFPPVFDWQGSENLTNITLHWPVPESIGVTDHLTLGYRDVLILPVTAQAVDAADPVTLKADINLGICEAICVPVHLLLTAPDAGTGPDPVIQNALANQPERITVVPDCSLHDISDGVRLSVTLPRRATDIATMELVGQHEIWVSNAMLKPSGNGDLLATADFIAPSGEPFDLDTSRVLITQMGAEGAVEMMGCQPASG